MELLIALLFIDAVVVALICKCYIASNQQTVRRTESQAHDRLLYIQILIDLVYTYKHNPEQLKTHLLQQMSIKKILCHHVIDDNCEQYIPKDVKLQRSDMLLYLLYKRGFSYRELCVMFELNNINTAYVKCHRVNKKLNHEKQENEPNIEQEEVS